MPFLVKERHKNASKSTIPPKASISSTNLPVVRHEEVPPYQNDLNQSSLSLAPPLPPYASQHFPSPQANGWIAPHQHANLAPVTHSPYLTPPPAYQTTFTPNASRHHQDNGGAWKSCTNLAANPIASINRYIPTESNHYHRESALCNIISNKLDDVISLIDEEVFSGGETELTIPYQEPVLPAPKELWVSEHETGIRGGGELSKKKASRGANCAITSAITSTNYFSKANLYANSRLPLFLPPLQVYMPTYPLLCLAAQYSERVYAKPRGKERDSVVEADRRMGTKAMVIKSVPLDDMNCVCFAIRGTQTFMDWAVNLKSAPTSPQGFLDDPGNLCHAGFLRVAKKMVKPVALRLRQMLEENPNRASCSLLITGHSAGGAVASLLFCHMLSQSVLSELTILTGCFKRVHCITFGAPPVSLLPLTKPINRQRDFRKSLFLSFINEGDPVPRADKAYVLSLLDLYSSPAPKPASQPKPAPNGLTSTLKLDLTLNAFTGKKERRPRLSQRPTTAPASRIPMSNIVWPVPPAMLSNAGRLVVLRVSWHRDGQPNEEDVRACVTTDEQMRSVMFGDPLMHQMKLYAKRVEIIATKAVTGKLFS